MAATPDLTQASAIDDSDPQETREWQEALAGVIEKEGAKVTSVIRGFKHIRLLCEYGDTKWQQTISVSSSSPRDLLNHRAIARRTIQLTDKRSPR